MAMNVKGIVGAFSKAYPSANTFDELVAQVKDDATNEIDVIKKVLTANDKKEVTEIGFDKDSNIGEQVLAVQNDSNAKSEFEALQKLKKTNPPAPLTSDTPGQKVAADKGKGTEGTETTETTEQKTDPTKTEETPEQKTAREAEEAKKAAAGKWSWWAIGSVVVGALAVIGGILGSEKKGMSIIAALGGILLVLPGFKSIYNWFRNITEAASTGGNGNTTEQAKPEQKPATEGAGG